RLACVLEDCVGEAVGGGAGGCDDANAVTVVPAYVGVGASALDQAGVVGVNDVAERARPPKHQIVVRAPLEVADEAVLRRGGERLLGEREIGAGDRCPGREAAANGGEGVGGGRI